MAARETQSQAADVLVEDHADTNAVGGQTPLHTAVRRWKDCPELCEILLKHGAKIGTVNEDGTSHFT